MNVERLGLVLLDAMPDDDRAFDASLLEQWDHEVQVCAGPEVKALCPLLGGAGCPKFDAAHGVIFKLDLDRPQHRAILRRYRDVAGVDLPIRVLCTREQAEQYSSWLTDVEIWDHEPTTADLDGFAAEVEAADRFAADGGTPPSGSPSRRSPYNG
jgi:hypothetical protein